MTIFLNAFIYVLAYVLWGTGVVTYDEFLKIKLQFFFIGENFASDFNVTWLWGVGIYYISCLIKLSPFDKWWNKLELIW